MSDEETEIEHELLMHTYHTLPKACKTYWGRRYQLFSKYDEGVFLSSELWYSVTPEVTAQAIALMVKKLIPNCRNVLDICCGGGGNTIQFAKLFDSVVGVDINSVNVRCTEHNCSVYGVSENTHIVTGDWIELSQRSDWTPIDLDGGMFDFVFCSAPWGGPGYKYVETFNLSTMKPFSLREVCLSIRQFSRNFGLFLPRNLDFDQIREVSRELGFKKTRVVCLRQDQKALAIMVFFGPSFVNNI
ncbi:S-adenosyl-L-methionine-dependent methyltransferase [Metschnikowia bicuspidata]|uniref:Trimethylguanosine synthase n=1 Tax=Metschnikowia bicuspidata TaxID=27322 RepID=A0A4P9Z8S6_9ASCO|nr:S-adenosyl-L-methionine-dependent methyltransferase [Metschnikowia bicuspidata]RKP29115.1 S-adenosyl-L-methionine-dependent methyltransferase [Metschnikowia bicuspidata]